MLRLFRQPGVRVAQQRIQLRRFTNLSGDQGGLSGLGEKREASRNAESEAKQHWAPNNNDRLVSRPTYNGLLAQLTGGWIVGSCQ